MKFILIILIQIQMFYFSRYINAWETESNTTMYHPEGAPVRLMIPKFPTTNHSLYSLSFSGFHRPLWAVFGEYLYCPPQRWVHCLEVRFSRLFSKVFHFIFEWLCFVLCSMGLPSFCTIRAPMKLKFSRSKALLGRAFANTSSRHTDL